MNRLSCKHRVSKVSLLLAGLRAPDFWGLAVWQARKTMKTVQIGQAINLQKPVSLKPGSDSDTFNTRYFLERLYLRSTRENNP